MTSIVKTALEFAKWAHRGQFRKFSGTTYFDGHIIKVWEKTKQYGATEEEEIAAILHDCVEDCAHMGFTHGVIEREFGSVVSGYVKELTSDKEIIEKIGKSEYMKKKLSEISDSALKIKLADRYCNICDLTTAPDNFRNKYYPETIIMMTGLSNRTLSTTHQKIIDDINVILHEVGTKFNFENI